MERVFCHGETIDNLKRCLTGAKINKENTIVQETGYMDSIITLNKGTNGAGIVALLGPKLSHVQLAVFNPREISKIVQK